MFYCEFPCKPPPPPPVHVATEREEDLVVDSPLGCWVCVVYSDHPPIRGVFLDLNILDLNNEHTIEGQVE